MIKLHFLIQHYFDNWEIVSDRESYKWLAFRHFKDNSYKDYANIREWISTVFCKTNNLYVITQIVITKSVNTFYVTLIETCSFHFRSAL